MNANATIASSIGRVGFTVSRHPDHPRGVYEIRFNTPAPNNSYVVTLTQQGSGNIKLWDSAVYSAHPTAERFYVDLQRELGARGLCVSFRGRDLR